MYFKLEEKSSREETLDLFSREPEFSTVSWKQVALALYHCSEEEAIDCCFEYMKSPNGNLCLNFNYCSWCYITFLSITVEYTLCMKNILQCLNGNLTLPSPVHKELRIPPRHIAVGDRRLLGVKLWLLTNSTASWQQFAMALYMSAMDDAVRQLKSLNLLSVKGMWLY